MLIKIEQSIIKVIRFKAMNKPMYEELQRL